MTAATSSSKSSLQIIDNLKFPPINSSSLSKLDFSIPSTVNSFSFHVYYDVTKYPGGTGYIKMILKGPNNTKIPLVGSPFLYTSPIKISTGGLSQGYGAVSIPVNSAQSANVAGSWQAKLDFNSFGVSNFDVNDLEVRVCMKTFPTGVTTLDDTYDYEVPVNLFYVGRTWRGRYSTILSQAIDHLKNAVYNQPDINLDFKPLKYIDLSGVTSDLYSAKTKNLVSTNAEADALNVFLVELMTIDVPGAVGFSLLPGPQGFMSPYTCVFASLRDPSGYDNDPLLVANRIGHEIGHCLGLIHQSSCLDTNCTDEQCDAALDIQNKSGEAVRRIIKNNLMFTSRPGNHLNTEQIFMMREAPIVNITAPTVAQPHPITKLRIKVKTGHKLYEWWRFDGPGTDDDVFFSIGGDNHRESQDVSSIWNDFEEGQNWWYTLDPKGLYVEDVQRFLIGKSYNINNHSNLLGDDAWLLDGLIIEINGVEVYNKQNINVWLHSNEDGPNSWGEGIPASALAPLL